MASEEIRPLSDSRHLLTNYIQHLTLLWTNATKQLHTHTHTHTHKSEQQNQ